ncbi:MAG: Ig-like domain repeat protein [Acidobacteriaceae bacterium]
MRLSGLNQNLLLPACFAAICTLAAPLLSAQQVTYYDFDGPQANPNQVSYGCTAASLAAGGSSIPLFCFNDATGAGVNPSFFLGLYPASIDPNPADNPPVSSYQYATQMTPSSPDESSSMWFSVPQKVLNGFTAYFAFKLTPQASQADGVAFVIQNAQGGGTDATTGCVEQGSGPSAVATNSQGGCIGYGGIDNSLALEFDTYDNGNFGDPNANHIALQSCGLNANGVGLPNSPDHNTCTVQLLNSNGSPFSAIVTSPETSTATPTPVNLADGNVHQVVVIYNGPNDTPANTVQVYLDPPFVAGTHTPDPTQGATPILQGSYNIATSIGPFINSGSANSPSLDSVYVGFTSATGTSDEQQEILAWTYTPHTTVTQQQPLNTQGAPTDFPFGTHSYAVTYPPNVVPGGITMTITANTISPALFSSLISPTAFAGSQCQIYDDTGGNCIVYSVSCSDASGPVACPAPPPANPPINCAANPTNNTNCVNLASAYNNSIQPVSPGFLQGDPFYTPIVQIVGDGSTATATCGTPTATGECPVTVGQTVTIGGQSAGSTNFNGTYTVASVPATNQFTFSSTVSATANGGYLTSGNVQNIFTSYTPQNLDGTSTGTTHTFSDFIATAVTTVGSQTQLVATTNNPMQGASDLLTITVTALSAQVPGPGNMPTGTVPAIAPSTVTFSTGSAANLTPIPGCTSVAVTPTSATTGTAVCSYTPSATGPVTVTAQYSDAYHTPSTSTLNLNVTPPYDTAIQLTFGSTTLTWPATTTESVCIAPATSVAATGSVLLYDGATLLKTQTLGSNGCATWVISPALAVGTHSITADYAGDKNNPAGNSAPVVITVNPATVLMAALCGPSSVAYGNSYACAAALVYENGLVKGTLNYSLDGGAPVSVPVTLGVSLFGITKPSVGAHQLVLSFPAQANYAAAGPQTETFTVTVAPVTVTLTPSTKSTTSGKTVTITASVSSASAGAPNGTGVVSFYLGASLLQTIPVSSSGVAVYSTSALPVGSDAITATYSGGTNYGTGSASVTIKVTK